MQWRTANSLAENETGPQLINCRNKSAHFSINCLRDMRTPYALWHRRPRANSGMPVDTCQRPYANGSISNETGHCVFVPFLLCVVGSGCRGSRLRMIRSDAKPEARNCKATTETVRVKSVSVASDCPAAETEVGEEQAI